MLDRSAVRVDLKRARPTGARARAADRGLVTASSDLSPAGSSRSPASVRSRPPRWWRSIADARQLQQRPAGVGLAWAGAATEQLERRQVNTPRDQQTRRRLPAHTTDPRRTLGVSWRRKRQGESQERLAGQPGSIEGTPNIAAVALANKNVRTVWALLAHGRDYQGRLHAGSSSSVSNQRQRPSTGDHHHRLLRRLRNDGKTGQTVRRNTLHNVRSTSSARKRLGTSQRDSPSWPDLGRAPSDKSPDVRGAILTCEPSRTESASKVGGVHVRTPKANNRPTAEVCPATKQTFNVCVKPSREAASA